MTQAVRLARRNSYLSLLLLPTLLLFGAAIFLLESARTQTSDIRDQQAISSTFSVRRAGPFVEILHAKKSAPILRFNPDDGFITGGWAGTWP